MQVVKQGFARLVLGRRKRDSAQGEMWSDYEERVWQRRFYDFNVWSARKRIEKLRYMHRNPVKRGLVESPEQWRWSGYRFYLVGEAAVQGKKQVPPVGRNDKVLLIMTRL